MVNHQLQLEQRLAAMAPLANAALQSQDTASVAMAAQAAAQTAMANPATAMQSLQQV